MRETIKPVFSIYIYLTKERFYKPMHFLWKLLSEKKELKTSYQSLFQICSKFFLI